MNLPESEKYFLMCFDKVINVEEDVIADPKEIKMYGELTRLEGEIEILEKFYNISPTADVVSMLRQKKKRFEEICKYIG